jgi:hypothetical protein
MTLCGCIVDFGDTGWLAAHPGSFTSFTVMRAPIEPPAAGGAPLGLCRARLLDNRPVGGVLAGAARKDFLGAVTRHARAARAASLRGGRCGATWSAPLTLPAALRAVSVPRMERLVEVVDRYARLELGLILLRSHVCFTNSFVRLHEAAVPLVHWLLGRPSSTAPT